MDSFTRGLNMIELKPCPNCKSLYIGVEELYKGKVINQAYIFPDSYRVKCGPCGKVGKVKASMREAIKDWNKENGT